jgi:hypothetical protein
MLNCENIMLIGLVSIIVIIVVLMWKKTNQVSVSPSVSNVVENFQNDMDKDSFDIRELGSGNSYKDKYDELKKYMEIQGMYPMGKSQDMSKYVLKSEVAKEDRCADMSKYILKASVPPSTKCPTINKDEWVRKTELPPNWNKQCPEHPDLTSYVLKSTIPPTQKCPSCICPKVNVDAGLCREPTEEDAIKRGLCKNACPKPEPLTQENCAKVVKCPEPKPCPPPPQVTCPQCPPLPEPAPCPRPPPPPPCPKPVCPTCPTNKEGKCPTPERCPPAHECPKLYDVKYIKVPVVKSEPMGKPDRNTIFPKDTITTKLLRQDVPREPRQPRILKDKVIVEEIPEAGEEIPEAAEENISAAPAMVEPVTDNVYSPSCEISETDNNRNNRRNNRKNTGECGPISLNNTFKKFGLLGFNNKS